MKFLFKQLVSCCGSQQTAPHHTDDEHIQHRAYLVRSRSSAKRRSSKSSRNGASAPDWKPSLYAISEDNVIAERNKTTQTDKLNNNNKRKISGQQNAKPRVRSYDYEHDNRGYSMHSAMPAFSPTPFMF